MTDHNRDILLLLFSLLGMLFLVVRGILLAAGGLLLVAGISGVDRSSSPLDILSMFFCAGLLIPLLVYCIRKLKGQEIPREKIRPIKAGQLILVISVWLLMVILGIILTDQSPFGNLIIIPVFLIGISAPIAGLAWMAIGGLTTGSRRRIWAAFGIGMAGSTFAAMILEYLLVGMGALIAAVVAAMNPEIRLVLKQLMEQVTSGGDIQNLLTNLAPFLTNPLVLIIALLFASVFVPIIEESLKPLAVWLLGKRLHSTAEGFALGALCGAGFAMLEGMQAAGGMSQVLGVGIAARAASSLMHITASGLMGWGIASARIEDRYGRLAGTFLLSIGIHGLWNGSVILAVFGGLRVTLQNSSPDVAGILLIVTGLAVLVLMLVAIIIALPTINHRLRATLPQVDEPPQSDIIAPLPS